jgi:hypothetical protein
MLVSKVGSNLGHGWERVPSLSGAVSLKVELVVHAIVGIPPFSTFNRESDTHHELLLLEFPLVVLELDVEAESIPSFIVSGRRRDVGEMVSRHLRGGSRCQRTSK